MTITFDVEVNDPLDTEILEIENMVSVTSNENPGTFQARVIDMVEVV